MSPAAPMVTERPPGTAGDTDKRLSARWWRATRATAAGLLVAGTTFLLLDSGLLPEPVSLLLVLLLVVTVPVSPFLAERVAIGLALVVGWTPVLWWAKWPGAVNHAAVVVSLVAGGIAAHVLAGSRPRMRLRSLVPMFRRTDLLLPVAGAAGVIATLPLMVAPSPQRALEVLVPGADNWAHFAMFANLRAYGAIPDTLGSAPDGSAWAFGSYPRSFHALAATVSELLAPRMATGAGSIEVYAHTLGAVVLIGLLMVTAAVLSLPRVGERGWLALPALSLTCTGLLWEPGQKVLANGFASFWVAAVASATALILGLAAPTVRTVVLAAAVGGLLVTVAHAWLPLLVVAAPAALLVLTRNRREGRVRLALPLALLALSGAAAAYALVMTLRTVTIGFVVSEVSGFNGTSPLPTFVLLTVLGYVVVRARSFAGGPGALPAGTVLRLRLLGLAPLLGLLSLAALLILQLRAIGTTSYYFLKYLMGFELILSCVAPAVCAMLLAAALPDVSGRRAWSCGLLTAVLGTQLFTPGWQVAPLLFSRTDDGTAAVAAPYSRGALAKGVLTAVRDTAPRASFRTEYVAVGPGSAAQTFYPDAWYHAANASVSGAVWERLATLRKQADTVDQAAPLVRALLQRDPRLRIVVEPQYVDRLRTALPTSLGQRVVPLGGGS